MTKLQRNSKRKKQSVFASLKTGALNAGPLRLFGFASLFALALSALAYYQYLSPQTAANDAVRQSLAAKQKQNAIARLVQETRPEFLDQFRRLISNYTTARELLPSETEVSNVLDAIQQMARANQVRVTMFDASKPGTRAANPPAIANTVAATTTNGTQPAQAQISLNERVMPAQIQGTHANVARFLSDIARYPRIIYVRDFSITSLNKQESVNLTLVTYDAPPSGILPPVPPELREEFHLARK